MLMDLREVVEEIVFWYKKECNKFLVEMIVVIEWEVYLNLMD